MMMPEHETILLSPPHLGDAEEALVKEAFETNWIAPVGPNIDAFEEELADCVGVPHACALTSGTAAIHLGLLLLGVQPGDLVLCSSLTFVASANPIRYCGAEPVFIDSDPDTWCMSVPALERALHQLDREGRKPRACVAVSLYGQSADLRAIETLCSKHGIGLLDEAAESLGATHGERKAGSFGDLGVYSFNGNKIITTSGGGALVGRDGDLIERARFLSTQARDHSMLGSYQHSVTGFNYRLSNVLAGIGRGQLKVLDERIQTRRDIFERYRDRLRQCASLSWMPEAGYGRATRWLSCCLLEDESSRDALVRTLQESGIDARPVWRPMHRQALFSGTRYFEHSEGLDVAGDLASRGTCLPSGSNLTQKSQDRVIEQIRTQVP